MGFFEVFFFVGLGLRQQMEKVVCLVWVMELKVYIGFGSLIILKVDEVIYNKYRVFKYILFFLYIGLYLIRYYIVK